MVGRKTILPLVLPILLGAAGAIDLDVNSADSIKAVAKTLISSIVSVYNAEVEKSGILGLLPKPYYFWEAGAVFNALVEYQYLAGDDSYNKAIQSALGFQLGSSQNFMPSNQTKTLGNDDQSTWALAALTAAELGLPQPKAFNYLNVSRNVWEDQVARWDSKTCDGGLRWQVFTFNNGYNYKNSVSTGQFFLLSARLAKFTGNATYAEWANKAFEWAQNTRLIENHRVYDGTDASKNCSDVNHMQWTSDLAIFTEGAAIMANRTDADPKWRTAVTQFVNASSIFYASPSTPILAEVACERNGKCSVDQKAMKGLAARSFARTAVSAPYVAADVNKMLEASAKAAAEKCEGEGEGLKCSVRWSEKGEAENSVSEGGLSEAFSVLEVVQGLLYASAKSGLGGNRTVGGVLNPATTSGAPQPSQSAYEGGVGGVKAAWGVVMAAAVLTVLGCY